MSKIYIGGTRHSHNLNHPVMQAVIPAIVAQGHSLHVGCQSGADAFAIVISRDLEPSPLHIFAVETTMRPHIALAHSLGARVTLGAGGSSAPINARYLLRSVAAFQGCSHAVFFNPGMGSLAVAREALKISLPVFAFHHETPAPIPQSVGHWVRSSFLGFASAGQHVAFCWQWSPAQLSLF